MALWKTLAHEAVGMFVADARLVASVLIWAAADAVSLRAGLLSPHAGALLLAVGVATLLVIDVVRAARAKFSGRA